ncbi:Oidioi.mRNA.OKI2018_I69.PAR.g8530.t1.cds [Oikopleura dioica]|uniref:Oidioi.mRNA.OKI2018_I69.PAR.g8530.t1.cds n=1 Tax=Oikopleura dioica TaxID=34765 RepID=A0ABN7RJZ3_OIKDI|nr:Oidioi.mRNA.OKI2018_I69.PAR.g8530.t1.cds [Oikopleura dioica]
MWKQDKNNAPKTSHPNRVDGENGMVTPSSILATIHIAGDLKECNEADINKAIRVEAPLEMVVKTQGEGDVTMLQKKFETLKEEKALQQSSDDKEGTKPLGTHLCTVHIAETIIDSMNKKNVPTAGNRSIPIETTADLKVLQALSNGEATLRQTPDNFMMDGTFHLGGTLKGNIDLTAAVNKTDNEGEEIRKGNMLMDGTFITTGLEGEQKVLMMDGTFMAGKIDKKEEQENATKGIDEVKAEELTTDLAKKLKECANMRTVTVKTWYRIPWTEVETVVSQRDCFLHQGKAYIAEQELIEYVKSIMNKENHRWLDGFAVKHDAMMYNETERLVPILKAIMEDVKPEEIQAKTNGLTYDNLEFMKRTSMPPCLRNLFNGLDKDGKLKYMGRLHLWSFLRNAGMTMEDALKLTTTKMHNYQNPAAEHEYHVKYAYGQVGKKSPIISYTCETKTKIAKSKEEYHLCPFTNNEDLKTKLESWGISEGRDFQKYPNREGTMFYPLMLARDVVRRFTGDDIIVMLMHYYDNVKDAIRLLQDLRKTLKDFGQIAKYTEIIEELGELLNECKSSYEDFEAKGGKLANELMNVPEDERWYEATATEMSNFNGKSELEKAITIHCNNDAFSLSSLHDNTLSNIVSTPGYFALIVAGAFLLGVVLTATICTCRFGRKRKEFRNKVKELREEKKEDRNPPIIVPITPMSPLPQHYPAPLIVTEEIPRVTRSITDPVRMGKPYWKRHVMMENFLAPSALHGNGRASSETVWDAIPTEHENPRIDFGLCLHRSYLSSEAYGTEMGFSICDNRTEATFFCEHDDPKFALKTYMNKDYINESRIWELEDPMSLRFDNYLTTKEIGKILNRRPRKILEAVAQCKNEGSKLYRPSKSHSLSFLHEILPEVTQDIIWMNGYLRDTSLYEFETNRKLERDDLFTKFESILGFYTDNEVFVNSYKFSGISKDGMFQRQTNNFPEAHGLCFETIEEYPEIEKFPKIFTFSSKSAHFLSFLSDFIFFFEILIILF